MVPPTLTTSAHDLYPPPSVSLSSSPSSPLIPFSRQEPLPPDNSHISSDTFFHISQRSSFRVLSNYVFIFSIMSICVLSDPQVWTPSCDSCHWWASFPLAPPQVQLSMFPLLLFTFSSCESYQPHLHSLWVLNETSHLLAHPSKIPLSLPPLLGLPEFLDQCSHLFGTLAIWPLLSSNLTPSHLCLQF